MHIETKSRSLAKALSWRIIASITTAAIAYAFGVPMKAVGLIFVADLIIKFLLIGFWHQSKMRGLKQRFLHIFRDLFRKKSLGPIFRSSFLYESV